MVFAHTIVEAPNQGASRRAAAISAPREAAPTTAARASIRRRNTDTQASGPLVAAGAPSAHDAAVCALTAVPVQSLPYERFDEVVLERQRGELERAAARARVLLAGRTIWNINSTATGGGV